MRDHDLNPPAIIQIATSLEEEFALRIKKREEQMVETTLEHAKLQGLDLHRVKEHLGPRKFAPWLKENVRFSRQTAYKYMKIAKKWEVICKRGLQITSAEDVFRKLFGKVKAKTKNETTSSREDGPATNESSHDSSENEKSQTEDVGAGQSDATSESPETEGYEPNEAKQATQSGADNNDQNETEAGKTPPQQERSRHRQKQKEDRTSDARNVFVVPIKNSRVATRVQSLFKTLLDFDGNGYGSGKHLIPRDLSALAREEDEQVQVLLATLEQRVKGCRDLKKMLDKASRSAGKAKFPEWGS